jgi:antitoxin component of RelBE/YafQ-DinJ toxin-antitoxin module
MSEKASAILHLRVTPSLKSEIERDAKTLGVSIADAVRFRLKTGHIPALGN